jgi:hypothetical protein
MKLSSLSWKFQREKKKKIARQNDVGFQEMAAILSPLGLYGGNRKSKIPLLAN